MPRVKLIFPDKKPIFIAHIPIRITDLNYGNHLGNDAVFSILHEARIQMLASIGCTEFEIGGCGMIMADVMLAYKNEGHYGDMLDIEIFIDEVTTRSFEILYKASKTAEGTNSTIFEAKTAMVCFDYAEGKVCTMPDSFSIKIS
jgi:acyl-CoA thioester hydrolase